MTVEQAAKELNMTPQWVRKFCRAGKLGQKLGREWAITREQFEQFKKEPRPGVGRPSKDDRQKDRPE